MHTFGKQLVRCGDCNRLVLYKRKDKAVNRTSWKTIRGMPCIWHGHTAMRLDGLSFDRLVQLGAMTGDTIPVEPSTSNRDPRFTRFDSRNPRHHALLVDAYRDPRIAGRVSTR